MSHLEKNLFPQDEDWLVNFYQDTAEIFDNIHFFSKYIKRRFSNMSEAGFENVRSAFLIEGLEIEFSKKCKTRDFSVCFGSSKLKLTLPDHADYDDAKREEIMVRYEERFSSIIKESHVRVMALFWRMLSPEARKKIQAELNEELEEKQSLQVSVKRQAKQGPKPKD